MCFAAVAVLCNILPVDEMAVRLKELCEPIMMRIKIVSRTSIHLLLFLEKKLFGLLSSIFFCFVFIRSFRSASGRRNAGHGREQGRRVDTGGI